VIKRGDDMEDIKEIIKKLEDIKYRILNHQNKMRELIKDLDWESQEELWLDIELLLDELKERS
jgi:hypothetical protein